MITNNKDQKWYWYSVECFGGRPAEKNYDFSADLVYPAFRFDLHKGTTDEFIGWVSPSPALDGKSVGACTGTARLRGQVKGSLQLGAGSMSTYASVRNSK